MDFAFFIFDKPLSLSFLYLTIFNLGLAVISLLVLTVQITFFILLLYGLKKPNPAYTEKQEPVSVIVCAHDEEENLRALLPVLLAQQYPVYEVIVVEDRCNDGTYDFLLQQTHEQPRLKRVRVTQKPEHINGKKFALTLGIKAAQYEWVLLTDADCRPTTEHWISQMSKQFHPDTEIVLGFSPYQKEKGLLNLFIRFEALFTGIQFMALALLGKPYMGVGRNLAYRKELFLNNKGFHEHRDVTGGDDDLFVNRHAQKRNTSVSLGKESLVESKAKKTVAEFMYQKFRHLSVGRYYRLYDKVGLAAVSVSWILTWIVVVPVLFLSPWWETIAIFFFVRIILLAIVMHKGSKKLGDRFESWKTPLLDFIYSIYYLVTGAKALFAKKVKWKV